MKKIIVKPEGRNGIWIPEKESLKSWIRSKKFGAIHNFIPTGSMVLGADHEVKSVLEDIDRAERLAVFTDHTANMGHALALVTGNKLECYDIGKLEDKDLAPPKDR